MALFGLKDGDTCVSVERTTHTIADHAWSCFYLLLAAGCDPQNICESFREVAEEIEGAWFDASD